MPEPVEPPEVYHHKEDGHHDGGRGEEFPENDDLFDRLEMVDIGRNNQKNRSRRSPNQISEIGDVGPQETWSFIFVAINPTSCCFK